MSKITRNPDPKTAYCRAGILLLSLAKNCLLSGKVDVLKVRATAERAQQLIADDMANAKTDNQIRKVMAAQQAAGAILAELRGGDPSGLQKAFDALVENHEGGPREFDLGGLGPIPHQNTAKEDWRRAAAIIMWKYGSKEQRDTLETDARKHLAIRDRKALRKLVSNADQGRLHGVVRHLDLAKALYDAGWTSLTDFC